MIISDLKSSTNIINLKLNKISYNVKNIKTFHIFRLGRLILFNDDKFIVNFYRIYD